mmetsp:Transcript_6744/g.16752  ORF Transcript_6744/g.16752 Transcript_6744/m.16752 type:complete len:398 (+) Transcript_6744:46-1239(+)
MANDFFSKAHREAHPPTRVSGIPQIGQSTRRRCARSMTCPRVGVRIRHALHRLLDPREGSTRSNKRDKSKETWAVEVIQRTFAATRHRHTSDHGEMVKIERVEDLPIIRKPLEHCPNVRLFGWSQPLENDGYRNALWATSLGFLPENFERFLAKGVTRHRLRLGRGCRRLDGSLRRGLILRGRHNTLRRGGRHLDRPTSKTHRCVHTLDHVVTDLVWRQHDMSVGDADVCGRRNAQLPSYRHVPTWREPDDLTVSVGREISCLDAARGIVQAELDTRGLLDDVLHRGHEQQHPGFLPMEANDVVASIRSLGRRHLDHADSYGQNRLGLFGPLLLCLDDLGASSEKVPLARAKRLAGEGHRRKKATTRFKWRRCVRPPTVLRPLWHRVVEPGSRRVAA